MPDSTLNRHSVALDRRYHLIRLPKQNRRRIPSRRCAKVVTFFFWRSMFGSLSQVSVPTKSSVNPARSFELNLPCNYNAHALRSPSIFLKMLPSSIVLPLKMSKPELIHHFVNEFKIYCYFIECKD